MGCVADKPIQPNLLPQSLPDSSTHKKSSPALTIRLPFSDKSPYIHTQVNEAIKKKDIILFQRAIHQHQITPHEFIGPSQHAKTVLHRLAESNFHEGMSLLLNTIAKTSTQPSQLLNMRDLDGNTPLLLCCLSNAVDTLEVLVRNEFVDFEARNFTQKTALEIALEMESPCVNVISSVLFGSETATKTTLKSNDGGSQNIPSVGEFPKSTNLDYLGSNTRTSLDGKSQKDLDSHSPKGIDIRFYEILNKLRVKATNFIDEEFPHEACYLEDEGSEAALIQRYPDLTWSRPSAFLNVKVQSPVLYEEFLPNFIINTPLAGCEAYSAFAVLAEYPSRLSKIFNSKEANEHGIFSLNLNVAGHVIEILLDDFFPSKDGSNLLFSHPQNNELWFSLLEKAFAKLHGGYMALESIGIAEAMETLTGMPVVQKSLKDLEEDKLWAKLIDYDKKNYIVCAGHSRQYHKSFRNRIFCVVSVTEVDGFKLIKLRNHFDDFVCEGDFSMNSLFWTSRLKEQVGYHESDTTSFYMQLKDFVKEFDFLNVCHYHENWNRNTMNVVCENGYPHLFELEVEKETETYISVHQKHPKFIEDDPDYDFSPVEFILAKNLENDAMENLASGEREAFAGMPTTYIHENHRVKLGPGKHTIYVKIRWVSPNKHDFLLSVLSSNPVQLTKLPTQSSRDFLQKLYLGTGTLSKNYYALANNCRFASGWCGSHLWMYACNNSDKVWNLEVTFEKMQNIKLGKAHRSKFNVIKFEVPPNQRQVAYGKRLNSGAVAIAWKFN